jgi:hypothetical protein
MKKQKFMPYAVILSAAKDPAGAVASAEYSGFFASLRMTERRAGRQTPALSNPRIVRMKKQKLMPYAVILSAAKDPASAVASAESSGFFASLRMTRFGESLHTGDPARSERSSLAGLERLPFKVGLL